LWASQRSVPGECAARLIEPLPRLALNIPTAMHCDGLARATESRAASGHWSVPVGAGPGEIDGVPDTLATMWTWVAKDCAAANRVLTGVPAPVLAHDAGQLGAHVCVGAPEHRASCSRAMRPPAAGGFTCGRWRTSG
jgi:hypothetical protein